MIALLLRAITPLHRQVEKTIAEVDVDHDGRVTLDEFVSIYLEFLAS